MLDDKSTKLVDENTNTEDIKSDLAKALESRLQSCDDVLEQ